MHRCPVETANPNPDLNANMGFDPHENIQNSPNPEIQPCRCPNATLIAGNLINTKHHKFMQFMMRDRAKAFKMFDTDGSYTLSLSELKAPNLSPIYDPEPALTLTLTQP